LLVGPAAVLLVGLAAVPLVGLAAVLPAGVVLLVVFEGDAASPLVPQAPNARASTHEPASLVKLVRMVTSSIDPTPDP
jgi:hypothetical protein